MKINKFTSIFIILLLFISFCSFDIVKKSNKQVIEVITPAIIRLNDEIICIPDTEIFTAKRNIPQSILEDKYRISHEDAIKLGYLTDKFAADFLLDKNVKIKYTGSNSSDCKFADIMVNNQSYKEHLRNLGYDLKGNFAEKLNKARRLNLVILNHNSNIYHKLNCEYGKFAHDIKILPKNELPSDARPCKFCHVKETNILKKYPQIISNGNIKLFLTDFSNILKPDNKCQSLVCQELLTSINQSVKSIDIAIYGWGDVPRIYEALKQAKARGVKIRIVYDISKNNYYQDTTKLLNIADNKSGDSPDILMHNKFIIFDDEKLMTGSMNFSQTGLSGFNSNAIVSIKSTELAKIFKAEFEQMLNGKFHNTKLKIPISTVIINNTKITPYFSPQDKIIVNKIIPLIDSAEHYVYIPAFIITHEDFSKALIRAHKRNVNIKIIIDATNALHVRSKVKTLRQAGIPVKIENFAGKMHSKSIIIDDKYLIIGSMNFSKSGENKNDENILVIEDSKFAQYYREFFEYLWTKIPDKYLKQYVSAESKETIGSCSDGIDNDYDGKIDLEDEACR